MSAIDTLWEFLAVAIGIIVVFGGIAVGLMRGRGGRSKELPPTPPSSAPGGPAVEVDAAPEGAVGTIERPAPDVLEPALEPEVITPEPVPTPTLERPDAPAGRLRRLRARLARSNSALGKAMTYLLKRWESLTLFLRVPGAPLDNNICERSLKQAILHRKNALFYRTQNGAWVGDLFMSLIHTCRLCEANPFDYLTELQKHADRVAANPQAWLPWNYRETLQNLPAPSRTDPALAPPQDTG